MSLENRIESLENKIKNLEKLLDAHITMCGHWHLSYNADITKIRTKIQKVKKINE